MPLEEERTALLHTELDRLSKLPQNSSYVIHRLKVIERALTLLQQQRTADAQQELEDLLNSLSL